MNWSRVRSEKLVAERGSEWCYGPDAERVTVDGRQRRSRRLSADEHALRGLSEQRRRELRKALAGTLKQQPNATFDDLIKVANEREAWKGRPRGRHPISYRQVKALLSPAQRRKMAQDEAAAHTRGPQQRGGQPARKFTLEEIAEVIKRSRGLTDRASRPRETPKRARPARPTPRQKAKHRMAGKPASSGKGTGTAEARNRKAAPPATARSGDEPFRLILTRRRGGFDVHWSAVPGMARMRVDVHDAHGSRIARIRVAAECSHVKVGGLEGSALPLTITASAAAPDGAQIASATIEVKGFQ